jgi:membrane-bound inhibitor of C-type lysozyme
MSIRALLGGALLLALCGCQRQAAAAAKAGAVNPDARVQTYRCDDGKTVVAGYPDPRTAVVTLGGRAYSLRSAMSGSGARYVGFGLQWWTKGLSEARLSHLKPGEDVASEPGVLCHTGVPASPGSR